MYTFYLIKFVENNLAEIKFIPTVMILHDEWIVYDISYIGLFVGSVDDNKG